MKKTIYIFKYEAINLLRGKIFYITLILAAFGFQQIFSAFGAKGGVISFAKLCWLPLNFILIPVMIISQNIGKSNNEIFKVMDIDAKHKLTGEFLAIFILDFVVIMSYLIVFQVMYFISGVSLNYYLYILGGSLELILITLISSTLIGFLIGQVTEGGIFGYILIGIAFIIMCSFYKTDTSILTLYNLPVFSSSLAIFKNNTFYFYHKLFWVILDTLLVFLIIVTEYRNIHVRINNRIYFIAIPFVAACVFLIIGSLLYKPTYYEAFSRDVASVEDKVRDNTLANQEDRKFHVFYSKDDCGYFVSRYNMDVNLKEKYSNSCSMILNITKDNIKNITFGLYGKLKVTDVKMDGKECKYSRDSNSITLKSDNAFNSGEKINILISCEGYIYTKWLQGKETYFVDDSEAYLGSVFEWYPKLNDNKEKQYTIKLNHKSKLYSNLFIKPGKDCDYLTGEDKDVLILSGSTIGQRKYKDYTLIGNEEYFITDKQCQNAIKGYEKYHTIVFVSPSDIDDDKFVYNDVYLQESGDTDQSISTNYSIGSEKDVHVEGN